MGIEPTQPAWKAGVLPLNYTRVTHNACIFYQKYLVLSNDFTGFYKKIQSFFQQINTALYALEFYRFNHLKYYFRKVCPIKQF